MKCLLSVQPFTIFHTHQAAQPTKSAHSTQKDAANTQRIRPLARRPNFTNQANPAAQQTAAANSGTVAVGAIYAKTKAPSPNSENPNVIQPIIRFMVNSFFFYYIKFISSRQAPNFHITFIKYSCYCSVFLLY